MIELLGALTGIVLSIPIIFLMFLVFVAKLDMEIDEMCGEEPSFKKSFIFVLKCAFGSKK